MTKIEWADMTINPFVGCSKCSRGCDNCYAEKVAFRLSKMPQTAVKYAGVVGDNGKWTGVISEPDYSVFDRLPRKPQRVFVGSMTDLFHGHVRNHDLRILFTAMEYHKQHTFMVLTKRPERMWSFIDDHQHFYLENVWLGVTVCNQREADEKIPLLLHTPASKRFVSIEPMLEHVDISRFIPGYCDCDQCVYDSGCSNYLDWVICGGETGPGARPMHPDWARSMRDQCQQNNVPFFFKGFGEWSVFNDDNNWRGKWSVFYDRDNDDHNWHNIPRVGRFLNLSGGHGFHGEKVVAIKKVGKKAAGRILDGREWNEVPS